MFSNVHFLDENKINNVFNIEPLYFIVDDNKLIYKQPFLKDILKKHPYSLVLAKEKYKTLDTISHLVSDCLVKGIDKNFNFVGIGGGIICDIVGFLSNSFMRGTSKLTFIPTTLLCLVDACYGGKNGVNHIEIKNSIGSIRHPSNIYIDLRFLKTLPNIELINGIAEILKYGVILEKNLLNIDINKILNKDLEYIKPIIKSSLLIKNYFVNDDPNEKNGIRKHLNFGHTIGHAIESVSENEIPHGIAIAHGMLFALELSRKFNNINITDEYYCKAREKITSLILPTKKFNIQRNADKLIKFIKNDKKKNNDKIDFILIKKIGLSYRREFSLNEIYDFISESNL